MVRIVIADDHTIMREGLKRILEGAEEVDIVGEATNGFEVLALVRQGGFDLLLLDLSMPGRSGVDLIRQVRSEAPKLAILILTMHEEEQYAVRAIRAGAQGYLTKESAGTQLVGAIRKVASGRPYISTEVAEQLALNIMAPVSNCCTSSYLTANLKYFPISSVGNRLQRSPMACISRSRPSAPTKPASCRKWG